MQKARGHPKGAPSDCKCTVSGSISPRYSRYLFTIGLSGVFSLTRWSWLIQAGLLVSRSTQDTTNAGSYLKYETITLFGYSSQNIPL